MWGKVKRHFNRAVAFGKGAAHYGVQAYHKGVQYASHVDHALMRVHSYATWPSASTLYNWFDTVGLQYGPGYRTLKDTWGDESAAAARLQTRSARVFRRDVAGCEQH